MIDLSSTTGYLVLQGEQVMERAVEPFGPDPRGHQVPGLSCAHRLRQSLRDVTSVETALLAVGERGPAPHRLANAYSADGVRT